MREKYKMAVDKTGLTKYYAVNPDGIEYTVTGLYDANVDYIERTELE